MSAAQASTPFGKVGKEQTDAMVNMQKEILDAYEQANRAWLARVKSEVEFWSELASKLSATRSVPEAMETYQQSVAQRMQMATEDGRRLTEDCQKIMQKFGGSMSNGWHEKARERTLQPCRSGAGELHPCNEWNTDRRAHISMGDAPWNRPATTM